MKAKLMTHAVTAKGCSSGAHKRSGLLGPLLLSSGPAAMSTATAATAANTTPAPTHSDAVHFFAMASESERASAGRIARAS